MSRKTRKTQTSTQVSGTLVRDVRAALDALGVAGVSDADAEAIAAVTAVVINARADERKRAPKPDRKRDAKRMRKASASDSEAVAADDLSRKGDMVPGQVAGKTRSGAHVHYTRVDKAANGVRQCVRIGCRKLRKGRSQYCSHACKREVGAGAKRAKGAA